MVRQLATNHRIETRMLHVSCQVLRFLLHAHLRQASERFVLVRFTSFADMQLAARNSTTTTALLTPREGTSTASKWRMTGCGPIYRKLNGRVYYAASDLEAFIESGKRIS